MSFRPNAMRRSRPEKSPSLLKKTVKELMKPKQSYSEESLLSAAAAGDIATVEFLLARGGNIEAKDGCNSTLLQMACSAKEPDSIDIVRLLLEKKANVNTPYSAYHETPLVTAILAGHAAEKVEMLLDANADITVTGNYHGDLINMLRWAEVRKDEGSPDGEAIFELIQEAWKEKYSRALARTKGEVEGMKFSELMSRMKADGGTDEDVCEAVDAESPRARMIEFIINKAAKDIEVFDEE